MGVIALLKGRFWSLTKGEWLWQSFILHLTKKIILFTLLPKEIGLELLGGFEYVKRLSAQTKHNGKSRIGKAHLSLWLMGAKNVRNYGQMTDSGHRDWVIAKNSLCDQGELKVQNNNNAT